MTSDDHALQSDRHRDTASARVDGRFAGLSLRRSRADRKDKAANETWQSELRAHDRQRQRVWRS